MEASYQQYRVLLDNVNGISKIVILAIDNYHSRFTRR